MSHTKQASNRKRRACAVPLLGAAGLSLSLASGAPAATGEPAADIPSRDTGVSHEITLGEEEISDVSLATFYVFDKENPWNIPARRTTRQRRLRRLPRLLVLAERLLDLVLFLVKSPRRA